MARKKTVEIDFIADTSKATKGIKEVGDTAEKQGSRFQQMGTKAKLGFAAAAVGVGVAIDFLKDAAQAALEDEKAQADLALALQNTTGATDAQIAATEEWIEQTSKASGIADDELRPALETLTRATGDLDEAQGLLATAMDISAATGKPLQTVIEAMGKAINNNAVGPLGRLGLKVKDASGEMLTFDEVMKEAQRTMGGAMETAASTGAGSMARLQVQFDEAKESLGAALIPALIEAADAVAALFDAFENAPAAGENVGLLNDDLYDLAHWYEDPAIMGIADFFGITLPGAADATKTAIERIGPAATAAMEEALPVFEETEGAADDLTGAVDDTTEAFWNQFDATKAMIDPTFALAETTRGVAEAVAAAKEAEEEYGEGTPEHISALDDVMQAWYRNEAAEKAVAEQAPVTEAVVRAQLEKMGLFTDQMMDAIIADLERWNAFRPRDPFANAPRDFRRPGGPLAHSGGTVPGAFRGQEVPILARAGEFVSQGGRPTNGESPGPIVVQFNVDGRRLFEQVVLPEQVKYNKRNGRPV